MNPECEKCKFRHEAARYKKRYEAMARIVDDYQKNIVPRLQARLAEAEHGKPETTATADTDFIRRRFENIV